MPACQQVTYRIEVAPWVSMLSRFQRPTLAHAAGWDAGNRSMQAAGRKVWSREDYRIAAKITQQLLRSLDK